MAGEDVCWPLASRGFAPGASPPHSHDLALGSDPAPDSHGLALAPGPGHPDSHGLALDTVAPASPRPRMTGTTSPQVQLKHERAAAADAVRIRAESKHAAAEEELEVVRARVEHRCTEEAASIAQRHQAARSRLERDLLVARDARETAARKGGGSDPVVASTLHSALVGEKAARLGLEASLADEAATNLVTRQHEASYTVAAAQSKLRRAADRARACARHSQALRGEAAASQILHGTGGSGAVDGKAAGPGGGGDNGGHVAESAATATVKVARLRERTQASRQRSEDHRRRTVSRQGEGSGEGGGHLEPAPQPHTSPLSKGQTWPSTP